MANEKTTTNEVTAERAVGLLRAQTKEARRLADENGARIGVFRIELYGDAAEALVEEIDRLRAIEALNVGAIDASLVRLGAVTGAIGPMPADPLAALEAAERRLLESARWTPVPDEDYRGYWRDRDGRMCKQAVAILQEKRRLAAKGGA